ncbi:MAG: hypothetical protein QNK23_06695 [Crocinitomicaceae bacterium]|nr:hypothetical protein [Crocinitomicaceae bacterium]
MSYYKESGKINLIYTLLISLVGFAIVGGSAYGYAVLSHINPFIYLNLILTLVYIAIVALAVIMTVDVGNIRNTKVAVFTGLVYGIAGVYAVWVSYISYVLEESFVYAGNNLGRCIELLSYQSFSIGRFGSGGLEFTGTTLYIMWGIEAALITIGPAIAMFYFNKDRPVFCEKCNKWARGEYKLRKKSTTKLSKESLEDLISRSTLTPLMEMENAAESVGDYYEFTFNSCDKCASTFYVKIEAVTNRRNDKGKNEEERKLMLPFFGIDSHVIPQEIKDKTVNTMAID